MNKQILNILDKALEQYKKKRTQVKGPQQELILKNSIIHEFAQTLKNKKTFDLKNVKLHLFENLTMSDSLSDEEKKPLRFKGRIIDDTLELRKQETKRLTTPIERNYAEAPLFTSSLPSVNTLIKLRDENGELVEVRKGFRQVQFRSKNGNYLSPFDFKVFLGLQKMWELKGEEKEFSFKYEELCNVIEGNVDGGTTDLIGASLTKLSTTSIIIEDFKDPNLQKRISTQIHNIIQSAYISHATKEARIIFNDHLHDGLREGNVIRINLSIYQDLHHATSKILYPLLGSILKENNEIQIDGIISSLGLERLEKKKAVEKIKNSFEDLKGLGIIDNFEFVRIGRSVYSVRVESSEHFMEHAEQGIPICTPS